MNQVEEITRSLAALPVLPKPHLTVGGLNQFVWLHPEMLAEYTRITGIVDVGWWREVYGKQGRTARDLVTANPKLRVALHLSPFWIYREDMPEKYPSTEGATDRYGDPALYHKLWRSELDGVRKILRDALAILGGTPIKYVTLDDEAWGIKHPGYAHDRRHLTAMMHRRYAYQNLLQEELPGAEIIWEQQGEIRLDPDMGWVERGNYPRDMYGKFGNFSCSLPCIDQVYESHETIKRTMELADDYGVEYVYPIISLYQKAGKLKGHRGWHTRNWTGKRPGIDYCDPIDAHVMGGHLNDPWFESYEYLGGPVSNQGYELTGLPYFRRCPLVFFEPSVWEGGTRESFDGARLEHFYEYVRGANNVG